MEVSLQGHSKHLHWACAVSLLTTNIKAILPALMSAVVITLHIMYSHKVAAFRQFSNLPTCRKG